MIMMLSHQHWCEAKPIQNAGVEVAVVAAAATALCGQRGVIAAALLTATLSDDVACAAGIDPRRERLALTFGLALVVAVAIKVVGALLIASMLIIPAAAARPFARSPEAMAFAACAIGVASALAGLRASWLWDVPAGPAVVSAAAACFALSSLVSALRRV